MALEPFALTTVATAEAELSIAVGTQTVVLERLIHAASQAIAEFCERVLHNDPAIVETLRGTGLPWLVLSRAPVLSVASVTYAGAAIDPTSYSVGDPEAGMLYRRAGWTWRGWSDGSTISQAPLLGTGEPVWTVTYAGGWVTPAQVGTRTLPYPIEEACLITVAALYRRRGQDRAIISEGVGAASVGYSVTLAEAAIPPSAQQMILPYARLAQAGV